MNTKGIKFLAVLAVLAMAFAVFAVVSDSETSDADAKTIYIKQGNTATGQDGTTPEKAWDAFNKATFTTGDTIVFVGDYTTVDSSDEINLGGKAVTLTSYDANKKSVITGRILLNSSKVLEAGTLEFKNITLKLKQHIGWETDTALASAVDLKVTNCDLFRTDSYYQPHLIRITGATNINLTVTDSTFTDDGTTNFGYAIVIGANPVEATKSIEIKNTKFVGFPRALSSDGYSKLVMDNNTYQMSETVQNDKPIVQVSQTIANLEVSITNSTIIAPEGKPEFVFHGNTDATESQTIKSFVCDMNVFTDGPGAKDSSSIIIPEGVKMTIPEGKVFDIDNSNSASTITVNGELENNGKIIVGASESIVIGPTGKITNKGTITDKGTITVSGSIANEGTIVVEKELSGTGKITGAGKVQVKSGGELNVHSGTSHQVYCSVDVYGGATFKADTVIYAATAGAVFGIGSTAAVKYATFKETVDSNFAITKAEFDVYADVTMNDGTWMSSNTYPDIVKVHSGKVTLGQALVIGTDDEVTLEAGSELKAKTAPSTETITVNGKLILAESAQYYSGITTDTAKNVKIEGQGGSEEDVKKDTTTPAGGTIDSKTFTDLDNPTVIITDAAIKDATVPTGRTVVINNAPTGTLDVSADNSQVTVNTTTNATFTVDTGAGVIKVTNLSGTFTFTRGSIVVEAKDWTGGDMELSDGDVLKISGTVDALAVNITVAEGGKATAIIGSDETKLTINGGKKLVIGANIAVEIAGDVDGAGTLDVAEKVSVKGKFSATLKAAKDVDVYGEVTGTITNSAKVIAHEKSDINKATIETKTGEKLQGKDANGGTWVWSGTDTLTLTGYTGNYNFEKIEDAIKTIVVSGDNKVTYTAPKEYEGATLFGKSDKSVNLTIKTVQGVGSLDIVANMSKAGKATLVNKLTVLVGKDISFESVDVKVTVSGTNSEWEPANTKAMKAIAVDAASVSLYHADVDIDVMSSYIIDTETYDTAVATGIASTGAIAVDDSQLNVETAGLGIYGLKIAVTASTFAIDAKLDALTVTTASAGDKAVSFSNSTIAIKGDNAIVNTNNKEILISGCPIVGIDGAEYAIVGDAEAAFTGETNIRNSLVAVKGYVYISALNISSAAIVGVDGTVDATVLTISQASALEAKGLTLSGAGSENNGTIVVKEMAAIIGTMTNKSAFTNEGTMGIYGTFTNVDPGVLTNDGTLTVYKKEATFGADKSFTLTDSRTGDTKAKLTGILFDHTTAPKTEIWANADGSISIDGAKLSFDMKDGFDAKDLDKFYGTLTPSQKDNSYTLVLTNGTATVTVVYTYDASKGQKVGDDVIITVSGVLVDKTDSTKVLYLESNKSDKTIAVTDGLISLWDAADSGLVLTSGKTVNNGIATIWSNHNGTSQVAAFNGASSTYEGSLISEIEAITLGGTFTGDLVANGTGLVTIGKKMTGDVYAKGSVTVSGTLVGDMQISLKAPETAKLTVSGQMLGDLIYVSAYKAASTDTTDTESTAVIDVIADMSVETGKPAKSFEINLAAATNATTTTAGIPGYFTLGTLEAPADAKHVLFCLEAGMLKVPASISLPERYTLLVEKDTTIEVVKGATFNVKNAAMKVSKDATSNFETGTVAETYGLVSFIMSFAIEDGAYTIYSDVAYALTNCDEGAELTVGSSAEISSNVAVKDGVNIIVNNVTLTFNGYDVDMADTAKFTVSGTGKIIFKASIDNGKPSDEPWEFYSVTANIVYGDNAVCFEGVRFIADSTITGVAATSTADAKISTTLLYNEGTATIAAGTGTGSITIANASYKLLKDDTAETLVHGTFVVAADAVFDAVAINDAFSVVDYEMLEGATVATIKDVKLMPTTVGVEGTLNLLNSTTVKGIYAGFGKITLASGKEFILAKSDKVPTEEPYTNKTIPGHVAAKIVDTTDDENGYVLNIVSAKDDATLSFKATTLKVEGETINVMTIAGDMGAGIINSTSDAFLNAVTVREDAAIFGDDVYIIGASKAVGYLGAVTMHMKEGTAVSDYSTLDYQATIVEDGYTVYTYFDSIDFEEATDVYLAADVTIEDKLDVSGKDVNIVIAEGKALTIKNIFIIGTPITVLGDEGSSIVGKVIIDNTGDKAYYLVAYADVDLSEAEIVAKHAAAAKPTDAVVSKLIVEENLYATIFAEEDSVKLSKADAALVPEIVGYNFTAWINYNGDANANVGETNAYADAEATLVFVTVKYVAGVDYYMNGVLFNVYDIPTSVAYGSYFTAKISDTAKYQGNPVINGQKTVCVLDDMELVASGVTPIPEPTPEPVEENTGLSLTDILLIVLVILIAIMVVILVLRLNRS